MTHSKSSHLVGASPVKHEEISQDKFGLAALITSRRRQKLSHFNIYFLLKPLLTAKQVERLWFHLSIYRKQYKILDSVRLACSQFIFTVYSANLWKIIYCKVCLSAANAEKHLMPIACTMYASVASTIYLVRYGLYVVLHCFQNTLKLRKTQRDREGNN